MKKNVLVVCITIILCMILVASTVVVVRKFDSANTLSNNNNNNVQNVDSKKVTAEEIINLMKEKNSNIGNVIVYNEETDLNNLLGRPNQYISKVQFADNRLDQTYVKENDAKGGTIEVFNNKEDLESRKKYIESISSQASIFSQYIYSKGYALLRLESDLTPEQAKEYENLFYEIVK